MSNYVVKLNKTTLAIDKVTYINGTRGIRKVVKSGTRKFVLLKNKPATYTALDTEYHELVELDATNAVVASAYPLGSIRRYRSDEKTELMMNLDSTGNLELIDSLGAVSMLTLVTPSPDPDPDPEEPTVDPDQPFTEDPDSLKDFIPEYINLFSIQIGIVEKF